MRKQYLLFIALICILSLLQVNCSKKNAMGATTGGSTSVNSFVILPNPVGIGGQITIKSKKLPPNANVVLVDETGTSYSIEPIVQQGDSIKFSLNRTIGMGKYTLKVLDQNNAETGIKQEDYWVLDEETLKTTPQIDNIIPNPFDIATPNGEIRINGKNFTPTTTTVILTNKETNTVVKELTGTDNIKVDATGGSITFSISSTDASIIPDVKDKANYTISVKVGNSTFIPSSNIDIINSNYPVISDVSYKEAGNNAGTYIKLEGSGWEKTNIFYKNDNGTETQINNLTDANEFFMPSDIASGEYTIVIHPEGTTMKLPAINKATNNTFFSIKPYITKIDPILPTNITIPIDYPENFGNTNIIGLDIEGANLLKDANTPAFTLSLNNGDADMSSPTTTNTKISYSNFSNNIGVSGNVTIATNEAVVKDNINTTFIFYNPVITDIIDPVKQGNMATIESEGTIKLSGRGLTKNMDIGFVNSTNSTDTSWVLNVDATTDFVCKNLPQNIYSSIVAKVNETRSAPFTTTQLTVKLVSAGDIVIKEINTIKVVPTVSVVLQFKGTNLTNGLQIKFFKDQHNTNDVYTGTGYAGTTTYSEGDLLITLTKNSEGGGTIIESPVLYFNLKRANGDMVWAENVPFSCIKNVVMGWAGSQAAQSPILSIAYFKGTEYTNPYIEFLGDNLPQPISDKSFERGIDILTKPDPTWTKLTGGTNISSNSFVKFFVNKNSSFEIGGGKFTYHTIYAQPNNYTISYLYYLAP